MDDTGEFAVIKFPPETFFHMVSTLQRSIEHIKGAGFTTCVLDMSKVVYLDSSSISALLHFAECLRERAGWVRVVNANGSRHLRRLFQIIGIDRSFPIYNSVQAAAEASAGCG